MLKLFFAIGLTIAGFQLNAHASNRCEIPKQIPNEAEKKELEKLLPLVKVKPNSQLQNPYNIIVNGKPIYELFNKSIESQINADTEIEKIGGSKLKHQLVINFETALKTVFGYMQVNAGWTLENIPHLVRPVSDNEFMARTSIEVKQDYAAIIDYSAPATTGRLYLLDFKSGEVTRRLVAHGMGNKEEKKKENIIKSISRFSNVMNSEKSSLGIYLTGCIFRSYNHGDAINLHGMESSNSNAAERAIIIHEASYVNPVDFEGKRIGLSQGCPAVSKKDMPVMIEKLAGGRILYGFYPGHKSTALDNKNVQIVDSNSQPSSEQK